MRLDRTARIILLALVVLDCFVWVQILNDQTSQARVVFLDVGQGDAELALLPGGYKILIDGGPPNGQVLRALEKVLPATDRYLDLVLATHVQLDHFGGLRQVVERYAIGTFLWNGRRPDDFGSAWRELETILRAKGVPILSLAAGDSIKLAQNRLDVLSPDRELWASSELNDGALVTLLDMSGFRTLFMSDAGFLTETHLASSTLTADVLKVGHHGSKTSSAADFLKRARPAIAVIEVGKHNLYGHPTVQALDRLAEAGAHVFRTDQDGTVEIDWTAGKLQVMTEKN